MSALIRLSAEMLFGDRSLPVAVRSVTTEQPTERVAAECVKVVFVTQGWSRLQFDDGEHTLSTGSIVVIPYGAWCSAIPESFLDTTTIYLHQDYLADQLQWLPPAHPLVHSLQIASAGECTPLTMNLSHKNFSGLRSRLSILAAQSVHAVSGFSTLAHLADLLRELDFLTERRGSPAGHHRVPSPPVRAVVHALRVQLDFQWTVEELSQIASLSESQLTRLFRKELGVTPAEYVWRVRAERMAELILTERLSVGEAGRKVGWRDQSVASRAFRRRYGMNPSELDTAMPLL